MKAIYLHVAGALALTFTIAGCAGSVIIPPAPAPVAGPTVAAPAATAPAPTPTPTPTAPPVPQPAPALVQEPEYESYLDAPQTPGTWVYVSEKNETLALFGETTANPSLIIRCDQTSRNVGIARITPTLSDAERVMQVKTETTTRSLQGLPLQGGRPMLTAILPARDTLLDAMAVTKGRFAVEAEGLPTLYVPAWVEVSRVVEDCR